MDVKQDSSQYLKELALEVRKTGWTKWSYLITPSITKEEGIRRFKTIEPKAFGWKFLIRYKPRNRALLIEADLASTMVGLAQIFSEVYLVSTNKDLLECAQSRIKAEAILNIFCIYTDDVLHLPFEHDFFDAVVISDINQICLEEVFRVLNPTGEVIVRGENKHNYRHLIRSFQSASSPRASLSIWEVEKRIKGVGFAASKTYLLLPSLDFTNEVVSCQDDDTTPSWHFKQALVRGKGFFKWFAPAFLIVGSKASPAQTWAESMIIHWCQQAEKPPEYHYADPVISRYMLGSPNVVIWVVGERNSSLPGVIFRIPLEKESLRRCQANSDALEQIRREKGILSQKAPVPISSQEFEGQPYFVEQEVGGYIVDSPIPALQSIHLKAIALLTKIHQETAIQTKIDEVIFNALISKPFDILAPYIKGEQDILMMNKVHRFLKEAFLNKDLPLVWVHGDFKIENMIINQKTDEIEGIIDWDLSQRPGLPLLDLIQLILFNQVLMENTDIQTLIKDKLIPWKLEDEEKSIVERYLTALHISQEYILPLSVMYWLHHVAFRHGELIKAYPPLLDEYYFRIIRSFYQRIERDS